MTSTEIASWTIAWISPTTGGSVAFHVAANAANDDASEFGDFIYTQNRACQASTMTERRVHLETLGWDASRCAVRQALADGKPAAARLENYHRLKNEQDYLRRKQD